MTPIVYQVKGGNPDDNVNIQITRQQPLKKRHYWRIQENSAVIAYMNAEGKWTHDVNECIKFADADMAYAFWLQCEQRGQFEY